ncbi:glycerol acyltransferase [Paracoccus sp. M683]|uniref:1-acyl-sn-glycerol-3-phosphate acyltransferase n=1 Tax=Paracoccus sp. M683 TaxID=2594268 RepID=UPI0011814D49|nr:1-acyl-sn-glycerol-3-phosphate acyltransferase [Paracoccus sp. M683]TRW96333.1 glycerol acyltransferase [Paracoccus sp. M683]
MDARQEMQARIDPLIEERAPWFYSGLPHHALARAVMMRLLRYPETLRLAAEYRDLPTAEIMRRIQAMMVRDVQVAGMEHLPATGPALIVSNHPTGIADGIVLHALISQLRDDLFIYANHDMIRVLPQTQDLIAPVEWRLEKRSHAKTRTTMDYTRAALSAGRIGLIFPSGRLAKRRWLTLHERPWMASAAMIARKFGVPVIPLHIRARNSALFYALDRIHASLRDVTLFNEVLNKASQPYRITIGAPIDPTTLPRSSEEAIELLRDAVLSLPEPAKDAPRLTRAHGVTRLAKPRRTTA